MDFGGADDVEGGGPGPDSGVGGHVLVEQVELGADLACLLAASGGGVPGALRAGPQHLGAGQAAHVVVGDVGDQVIGRWKIFGMRGDRAVPVVGREFQLQPGRDQADA